MPKTDIYQHQQNVKTTPGPPRGVMVPLVLLVHPDPPWSTLIHISGKISQSVDQSGLEWTRWTTGTTTPLGGPGAFRTTLNHPPTFSWCQASKKLKWWLAALAMEPELSINRRDRETISLWSEAAGRKGLGAFYINCSQSTGDGEKQDTRQNIGPTPLPGAAFSIPLPRECKKNERPY